MTTKEIIEELCKKSNVELEYVLTLLMQENKINYLHIQEAYIRYLQNERNKNELKLIEAETCIMESLMYDKINTNDDTSERSMQRRLYFLNNACRRFNMKAMNEHLKYDAERAKSYSLIEDSYI